MDKERIIKEGRWINIVLAILLILSVIGWVIDEERDNLREGQLKQVIVDYEGRYVVMAEGANRLYSSLKECRRENG